jgi:hypothetical protein
VTGTRFDPAGAGTVEGRVRWRGAAPAIEQFCSPDRPMSPPPWGPNRAWDNPLAPRIGPDGGVAELAVFLRGVDPERSRPWDLPPVRVEQRDHRYHVLQGNDDSRLGFVRRGEAVAMVSRDAAIYKLRARGADFFTLAFIEPHRATLRRLARPGVSELQSGAGHVWMRAFLFVDDHPYYARTNAEGRFRLTQVPAGDYELVVWAPNWREQLRERDPTSTLTSRLTFRPPVEVVRRVTVRPGPAAVLECELSVDLFAK